MENISKTHQWIETEDGSKTLYSPLFDENCHSTSGAISETKHTYLDANRVAERLKLKKKLKILEIGLGTGIGLDTTLQFATPQEGEFLHYVAVEIDPFMIENFRPSTIENFKWQKNYHFQNSTIALTVLFGDARKTLKQFLLEHPEFKFDVIYQDAFSPKKNPTLWTQQWFELLGSLSHAETSMSTYSSTKRVQKAMQLAGWGVHPIKGHPPKKWSTLAYWKQESSPELSSQLQSVEAFTD
ncbi:MAG: tRNA (5-methylaminomethyl-2-thiouridine)(34)-methyltransferase MnmD [Bdellovibrio sp.]